MNRSAVLCSRLFADRSAITYVHSPISLVSHTIGYERSQIDVCIVFFSLVPLGEESDFMDRCRLFTDCIYNADHCPRSSLPTWLSTGWLHPFQDINCFRFALKYRCSVNRTLYCLVAGIMNAGDEIDGDTGFGHGLKGGGSLGHITH